MSQDRDWLMDWKIQIPPSPPLAGCRDEYFETCINLNILFGNKSMAAINICDDYCSQSHDDIQKLCESATDFANFYYKHKFSALGPTSPQPRVKQPQSTLAPPLLKHWMGRGPHPAAVTPLSKIYIFYNSFISGACAQSRFAYCPIHCFCKTLFHELCRVATVTDKVDGQSSKCTLYVEKSLQSLF